jgi:N-acyl-D-aspartate/D-glutamate deacylase
VYFLAKNLAACFLVQYQAVVCCFLVSLEQYKLTTLISLGTMSKFFIRGGLVFDGSGQAPYQADLQVADGRVEALASSLSHPGEAYQTIEAEGHWVMPGFIDIHTHYDAEVEIDAGLFESVRHGITTIFMGSCGLSMVMGPPESLSDMFTRVEGVPSEYIKPLLQRVKDWDSPTEYLQHLRNLPLGPNVAMFLGHSTLRSYVMGLKRSLTHNEKPTKAELSRMDGLLREALDAGYMGLSVNMLTFDKMDGTEFRSRPTPSVYAGWGEYRHLFRTLRQQNRILQTIPNTANPATFFSFMLESAALGRKGLKTSMLAMIDGKTVPGIHRIFGNSAWLANRLLGAKVKFQGLPEPFDVVTNGFNSPFFEEFEAGTAYLHLEDLAERQELLQDKRYRRKFRKQWGQKLAPRAFHRNLRDTCVIDCPDASLNGRSFRELAKEAGQDPVDYFLDLVSRYGDELRWYTVVGNHRPKELNWIVRHPDCHIGFSDAGAHLKNMAHYNFPLRLFKFVQEQKAEGRKTLSLAQAVRKVTGELADWYGLDAGYLAQGRRADIVLVDPTQLNDQLDQTYEVGMPGLPEFKRWVRRNDQAVPYVFINGQIAAQSGQASPILGQAKDFGKVLAYQG